MAHDREEKLAQFGRVLDVMDKLREKCPWNGAQTWDTLRSLTVEEVYELSDAVMKKDDKDLEKELGDLLLHIVCRRTGKIRCRGRYGTALREDDFPSSACLCRGESR